MSARVLAFFVVLALGGVAAAGCITPSGTSLASSPGATVTGWPEVALPYGGAHDHRDWSHHVGLSTPNFHELSYDALPTDRYENKTAGGYFCGGSGVTTEGRKIALVSSFDTEVAFVVVDVTDPTKVTKIGEYLLPRVTTYDADMTADGRFAVVAADLLLGPNEAPDAARGLGLPVDAPLVAVQPMFRDTCTGETRAAGPEQMLPASPGTFLVSLADPTAPEFADFAPAPVIGPHSVSTAIVDNVTYVAASTTNLVHHASYFQFFEVLDTPVGGRLLALSMVTSGMYGKTNVVSNGHVDAEIAKHPGTGQLLAYLSDWDGGLVVLDLSNPRAPVRLSEWADEGVDGGNVHSTFSVPELWDGKHYVLVGQEFTRHPENRPSGWVYILDDTDPANPIEVGRWTLPIDVDPEWGGTELFSTHYFRVLDRTLYVSMYHGGVWAVDLSTEEKIANPPSIGAFIPDKAPPQGRTPDGFYDYAPFVLDLFAWEGNYLTVFDGLSGVYGVHFDLANPMTPPAPWPAEGK